jgi:RNA polymerase sigma factor (TIGR02999 family)
MPDVTQMLEAIEAGDSLAANQLLPVVYDELKRMAAVQMAREQPGQTLSPTALVHEAYLRLVESAKPQAAGYADRRHFFASAAEAMRRILVENARRRNALKRGGNLQRAEFDEALLAAPEPAEDVLALDEALDRFAQIEPVKAELVKLRYFAGLTSAQAAESLQISHATAERYWAYARAWLYRQIAKSDA